MTQDFVFYYSVDFNNVQNININFEFLYYLYELFSLSRYMIRTNAMNNIFDL